MITDRTIQAICIGAAIQAMGFDTDSISAECEFTEEQQKKLIEIIQAEEENVSSSTDEEIKQGFKKALLDFLSPSLPAS